MGNAGSCPADFDSELLVCRSQCPPGFKFGQNPNNPKIKRCLLFTDNSKFFDLKDIPPMNPNAAIEPVLFKEERERVTAEATKIISLAPDQDDAAEHKLQAAAVLSQYASYQAANDAGKKIKYLADTIAHPRPTVQPNEIQSERHKILEAPKISVIQTALFTILLALAELLVIPIQYAQGLVFLTLCVGAAVGIYLANT